MSAQEQLNSFAASFVSESIKLSAEQQKLVAVFEGTKKAHAEDIDHINQGRAEAVKTINDQFDGMVINAKKAMANAKESFETACIASGLKKENIPLSEYQITRAVDAAVGGVFTGYAKVTGYFGQKLNAAKAALK